MQTEDISAEGVRIAFDRDELLIIANTLNLVCHGLEEQQFSSVIGADLEAARALWTEVSSTFDALVEAGGPGPDEAP